ncbi:cullin 1 [Metschnikowia aff. pulcherrima]|uniref:Cullin 1 n=1 Tax=Metschnikowia aff. pulcherrima TaxID=2163413 RepID=A0A4P6XIE7_9ASCO|nr:cullin 1 [Metschnikowia aff. pulcherrima]
MSAPQTLPIAGDLEATWNFIEPGLEFILGAQGDQGVTLKMYMNCYTAVYNYCTNKSRSSNPLGAAATSTRGGAEKTTYSLTGAEIYYKLEEYLVNFIRGLRAEPGELFLEFYVRKWKRFTIGAGYMNNVFDYMNRYWVQKERSDGRRDVFDVNTLALLQWKQHMFDTNVERIRSEIFALIERQRNNEIVDTNVLSVAVKLMVFLGIDVNDLKKPNMVVYATCFETFFLEKTIEYYRLESAQFLLHNSVVDYMVKCESRLAEEISRSNNYLEDRSKRALLETLHTVLIKDHANEMYEQFVKLLERNETVHILRMYTLLAKVPSTLQALANELELFIRSEAAQAIQDLKTASEAQEAQAEKPGRRPQLAVSPKAYIHTLVRVYEKFNDVVFNSFKKDPLFIKSLDSACRHFVNVNVIATPTPKAGGKSPELLAKYADAFLKATGKEADIENMTADNLVLILKYIEDKDVFENHYRRLLAKRLINSNTKSDELEEGILQKLQEGNSLEFTSKITKMFQDMKSSEDLKVRVRDIVGFDTAVGDFSPLILAQSMWPFVHNDDYNLKIAPELQRTIEVVEQEYGKKHNGRNLQWLWNHGKNEVKANLSRKGKPPFIFTVSNVQLMILLAFNDQATHTYSSLIEAVGVAQNVLDAHLLPFVKFKLIEQSPPAPQQMNDAQTTFTIVTEYKSKKLKVNFVSSIRNEQKQEETETDREIEESRKSYLSASIVRIMKARKTMKHNDLVNEVLLQAHSRFKAKLIDLKRAIEYLLDKEYIARREGDTFEYLA